MARHHYARLTPGELPVALGFNGLLQSLLSDLVCDCDMSTTEALGYIVHHLVKAAETLSLEIEDVQT